MLPLIVATAIQELPGIIDALKRSHAAANPDAPPMTDEQAKAALMHALMVAGIQVDDDWLSQHPVSDQ
jgi:hypothetical protein